jgi:hypothetical protein
MSTEGTEALMELGRSLLDAVNALRADLKRREARDLEASGRIPAGSAARAAEGKGSASGPVFPNYGRSKNQPIAGATMADLEYYAAGCRRTLGDPAKVRFHEKERNLLADIEDEIARQGGSVPEPSPPPPDFGPGDDDCPF